MQDVTTRQKEPKDKVVKYINPIAKGKLRNDPCPCGSMKKIKKCHGVNPKVSREEFELIVSMVQTFNKRLKEAFDKNLKEEIERLSKGDLSGTEEA